MAPAPAGAGAATYNISAAFRLTGSLDQDALVAAIRDVVERHEILRTTYATDEDGEPYSRILTVAEASPEAQVADVAPEDMSRAIDEAVSHGFDLEGELPFRAHLLRCSPRSTSSSWSSTTSPRTAARARR